MAVFRIERTRDYTVMSNHHLRNANLSLKAKGLLSMMLSLPEDWNYTTRGLAKICNYMAFFEQAITVLQTLVIALGAGLGIWGVINLLEGYGNDNPGAKSQGMKQLMAGAGVAVVGMVLVPLLSGLFSV